MIQVTEWIMSPTKCGCSTSGRISVLGYDFTRDPSEK